MKTGKMAVAVLIGCMLLAGCATQSAVTKDTGASPATTAQTTASTQAKIEPKTVPPKATETSSTPAATSTKAEKAQAADAQPSLIAVYFAFNSSSLDKAARETLQKDVALLKGKTVKIEGHCDERGSDEYNLALGERRAHAAEQYLITLGFPADRLSIISYGKERPAASGHDEASWAKNRRAEVVVVK